MPQTTRILGMQVRELRLKAGLSQKELAQQARVSREWLGSFENGKPTVEIGMVLDVIGVLGYTVEIQKDREYILPLRTLEQDN